MLDLTLRDSLACQPVGSLNPWRLRRVRFLKRAWLLNHCIERLECLRLNGRVAISGCRSPSGLVLQPEVCGRRDRLDSFRRLAQLDGRGGVRLVLSVRNGDLL